MNNVVLCPKCQAICDPDTGECLICGERHHQFSGAPINFVDIYSPAYFTFPILTEKGPATLTFYGYPKISNYNGLGGTKNTGELKFQFLESATAISNDESTIFTIALEN